MSIQPHRIAFVLDRVEKSWDASLAGLVARTIHPFDDQPAPPRRLEKAIRKRCHVLAAASRPFDRDAEKSFRLSRDAVVDYIDLARQARATYFVNQWSTLLSEFDRHMRERADASLDDGVAGNPPPRTSPGADPRARVSDTRQIEPVQATGNVAVAEHDDNPSDDENLDEEDDAGLLLSYIAAYVANTYVRDLADQVIERDNQLADQRYTLGHLGFNTFCSGYVAGVLAAVADGTDLDPDRCSPRYVAFLGDAYVNLLKTFDFDASDCEVVVCRADQLETGRRAAQIVSSLDDWVGDIDTFQLVDWFARDCFGAGYVLAQYEAKD